MKRVVINFIYSLVIASALAICGIYIDSWKWWVICMPIAAIVALKEMEIESLKEGK